MQKSILILVLGLIFISCNKDDDNTGTSPNSNSGQSNFPAGFEAFENIFDGEGVGAAVNLGPDVILLFNMNGTRYAWFEDEEIKVVRDLNNDDGPFATAAVESVGATTLSRDNRVFVFNAAGTYYTYANFEPTEVAGGWNNADLLSWNSSANPTDEWGPDGTIPFSEVSAMWMLSDPGDDCFGAEVVHDVMYMFDEDGDEFTRFSVEEFAFVDGPAPLHLWRAQNNCDGPDGLMPFEKISAGCRYIRQNTIQEVFFSEDGMQFCFYTVSEGVVSEVYDLY